MKIGILTIHFGRNCGSALQAYALNRYLTKQGHEVRTIDYIPERFSFRNKYRVGKNRNAAVSLIASVLKFPKNFLQYTAFDGFLRKYVPMTRRITDTAEMQKYAGDFEALIVGSDQVWNPEYNGESQRDYYLEFEEGMSVRRIAYAASIGLDKLPEEIGRDMARALSGFSAVSVREKSGAELLGAFGISAEQCIDPVFLLTKQEWSSLAAPASGKEPYIFVYALGGKETAVIDYAEFVARRIHAKIVYMGFAGLKDKRIDRQYIYGSPKDFVRLLSGAEFVVTNSFHATAFSLIFEKKFLSVSREKFNSRLMDILKACGLENRLVAPKLFDRNVSGDVFENIDYEAVKARMDAVRVRSEAFLKRAGIGGNDE